jgi:osmoprotectant transport system permease protein
MGWHDQLLLFPERLAWHVLLTFLALTIGILISLPLATLCLRFKKFRGRCLAVASVVQTVPSLALLATLVVILGSIGFAPALFALVLYSILPILRNMVTGIIGVDAAPVEAARGMGMTERQLLLKVQMPLATPVIMAGIRTSAVWVVGIATLATPVGQLSLGNYIFEGLQLRNNVAVLIGVAGAAGLALLLDGLIRALEIASERRSLPVAVLAGSGLCVAFAGGLAPLFRAQPDTVVGAKTFTEQYILADLMTDRLKAEGFDVQKKQGMGSSILFESLARGNVDCYVDYSGTIWTNVMKRTDAAAPDAVLAEVTAYLKKTYGIVCVGPLGFENAYAVAMPRARADELAITSIDQLAMQSAQLKIGGDYEFFGRPEWIRVRDAYGLKFDKTVALDGTLMYTAAQSGQVDAIAAFSSDGRIAAFDFVVLPDPRHAFPPYQAILLVSQNAAARPGFVEKLKPLVGSIDDDAMRHANKLVDVDGKSPVEAMRYLSGQNSPAPTGQSTQPK